MTKNSIQPFIGLVALLFVVLASACKTPQTVSTETTNRELTAEDYLNMMTRAQVQAEWIDATAKVNFDDGSTSIGGTASIKMHRNEVIWMSVRKFGFEVARAKVTQDSLYILDRFNKEYAVEPLSYVEEKFRLPANLEMLQQLLLGNPVYLTRDNAEFSLGEENAMEWTASDGTTVNTFGYTLPNYQLDRMDVRQEGPRELGIELLDYRDAGANRDFSYLRKISVNSRETGRANIELEFNKVEVNVPTDIPFSVPSNYERN